MSYTSGAMGFIPQVVLDAMNMESYTGELYTTGSTAESPDISVEQTAPALAPADSKAWIWILAGIGLLYLITQKPKKEPLQNPFVRSRRYPMHVRSYYRGKRRKKR